MARLLTAPSGLGIISMEPLSGPRVVGGGGSQSMDGFVQTSAAPFGLWRWQFSFHSMREDEFRRYRGWITALHGGANATRWSFFDPDMMRPSQAGFSVSEFVRWDSIAGLGWSNGEQWSNGMSWKPSPPLVRVGKSGSRGATTIALCSEHWGDRLDVGDYFSMAPFYFGLHVVTEVLEPGSYRFWPPLRKAITTTDFMTLNPVLAMRLESEDSAKVGRGLVTADSASIVLIECLDYDVRDYWAD